MPRLIAAVYVKDPATHEELILLPGECPDPTIAALVTNPDAWDVAPGECAPVPVPVVVGGPDLTTGRGAPEPEQEEVGGGEAKKAPSRRSRSSSASS